MKTRIRDKKSSGDKRENFQDSSSHIYEKKAERICNITAQSKI